MIHTAAAANPRDSPGDTELDDVAREPAAETAEPEDGVGEQETRLAAEDVAQLSV